MRRLYLLILATIVNFIAQAQGSGDGADIKVNVNEKGGFFTSPLFWIIVAAVFILLLVALTRGRARD